MTGIWEFPELDVLEEFILTSLEIGKEISIENLEEEQSEILEERVVGPERLIVVDEWGNGTAEIGDNKLRVLVFYGMEDEQASASVEFDPAARTIVANAINAINRGDIPTPDLVSEWFTAIDYAPNAIEFMEDAINLSIGTSEGDRVFDLTDGIAIEYSDDVNFSEFPRIPLETLREEEIEGEQEDVIEEEIEDDEVEEELTEGEELEQEFPDLPPHLRVYAKSENKLEVPNGTKDTKTVSPRDPYGFEIVMATGRVNPQNIPFRTEVEVQQQTMPEIGEAIRSGNFGDALVESNQTAPGSYPRTGIYIRNHLKFNEPSYALQIHKDILIYTAFVNQIYNFSLSTGRYDSFREYIYVLKEIPQRDGPVLIESMSQQQAASLELEVVADHPTIEGAKAPWLENRQYYTLVEENEDHEAWSDPYGYLHEVLE